MSSQPFSAKSFWICWKLFKTGEIAIGRLSKVVGAVLPAFQKRIVRRQPICQISKPVRLPLAGFQKLSAQLWDICFPIGAKDLNSPVLKRFQKIQKLLAPTVKNLIIQFKLKELLKKLYISARLSPNQGQSNHTT